MLTHVVVNQPEDPIAYFHEELSRIKKEVEDNDVSLYCTVHVVWLNFTWLLDPTYHKPGHFKFLPAYLQVRSSAVVSMYI